MKISGFTFARNASLLYYPIRESILSILPIVDEFIVNIGKGDPEDNTRELIESIQSPKIKIIESEWNLEKYPHGTENAHQTDIAKNHCTGDWLFYLQADEVVHEKYLENIVRRCEQLANHTEIEGLLFRYIHFYGDYKHYVHHHGWYPYEIRIIRNDPDIHSFASAQSFRRIPHFDGIHYREKKGTIKLKVAKVDAAIYHYGWVRPPALMTKKSHALATIHKGAEKANQIYSQPNEIFNYGPLGRLKLFNDSHPAVMQSWIKKFNWKDQLNYGSTLKINRPKMKHEKMKYRLATWIEQKLFGGKRLFYHRNWRIIKV